MLGLFLFSLFSALRLIPGPMFEEEPEMSFSENVPEGASAASSSRARHQKSLRLWRRHEARMKGGTEIHSAKPERAQRYRRPRAPQKP